MGAVHFAQIFYYCAKTRSSFRVGFSVKTLINTDLQIALPQFFQGRVSGLPELEAFFGTPQILAARAMARPWVWAVSGIGQRLSGIFGFKTEEAAPG